MSETNLGDDDDKPHFMDSPLGQVLRGAAFALAGSAGAGLAVGVSIANPAAQPEVEGKCNELGPGGIRCRKDVGGKGQSHKKHTGRWLLQHVTWRAYDRARATRTDPASDD